MRGRSTIAPRWLERAAVSVVVTLFLASAVFALLAIWWSDPRWIETAAVTWVLILLVSLGMVMCERNARG